jgi:hypothetical protein
VLINLLETVDSSTQLRLTSKISRMIAKRRYWIGSAVICSIVRVLSIWVSLSLDVRTSDVQVVLPSIEFRTVYPVTHADMFCGMNLSFRFGLQSVRDLIGRSAFFPCSIPTKGGHGNTALIAQH